jgi:hypothetical protein
MDIMQALHSKRVDKRSSPGQADENGNPSAALLSNNQAAFLSEFGSGGLIQPMMPPLTPDGGSVKKERKKNSALIDDDSELGGGRWDADEDEKLRAGVAAIGAKNWKKISQDYLDGSRSDVQCLHRWQKVRDFSDRE